MSRIISDIDETTFSYLQEERQRDEMVANAKEARAFFQKKLREIQNPTEIEEIKDYLQDLSWYIYFNE